MAYDWARRADRAEAVLFAAERTANGAVYPTWIDAGRFWYERTGDGGVEYAIVAAASGARLATVSKGRIAEALAAHLEAKLVAEDLILGNLSFAPESEEVRFTAHGESYIFNWGSGTLKTATKTVDRNWVPSPDGSAALLMDGDNLKLRQIDSGEERLLTQDGTREYPYSAPAIAMRALQRQQGKDAPEALWSPDGRWILTLQCDERHVPDLSFIEYAPMAGVRPVVHTNPTSLPEDPKVTEFRMIAIEAETGRQVEARYPRLVAVRMNTTPFGANMVWWSADSRTAYFVDVERGEQRAHVVAFDVETGTTRIVFTEESSSYVELSVNVYTKALLAPLTATNELIWYSERTGRGHLYLYDLATGALKRAITEGDWQVRDVLRVDPERREVFLMAGGINPDENPYICKPCIASLDGGLQILSDAPGEHVVWRPGSMALMIKSYQGSDIERISGLSPDGTYFIETVSKVDELPRTWLRGRDGKEIALLEAASAEAIEGWHDPEPVECMAADGVTKTYGLLFKPLGYEPGKRYPLIDLIYGGPQIHMTPSSHYSDGSVGGSTYLDAAHLSSLGAWVLILDGRGTAEREQLFRTASYRAAHTASNLEDHVAAIRELAEARGEIDLDRVGITGFSGGGYMSAHAALRFGDFFKVTVAGGGNYDQALFWQSWGERYHGDYDAEHYAAQAAKTYAEGLKGKLLLVHGLVDHGCHPGGLFQLVQRLIEADKDPDLVLLPRGGHDWTGYGLRRRWDYFITHLFGEAPPARKSFDRPYDHVLARYGASLGAPAKVEE
ncbi:MAG: DPP IV N-terminal domain-containing protein [Chakrabartia sp.]